eukprot:c14429_g1_i1.p1 GENE.c14429_g1_i1~~c14429_g1_i1.p1  ORF type:complete len:270 (+),score=113.19 c14429_g1_i1:49-858(+)
MKILFVVLFLLISGVLTNDILQSINIAKQNVDRLIQQHESLLSIESRTEEKIANTQNSIFEMLQKIDELSLEIDTLKLSMLDLQTHEYQYSLSIQEQDYTTTMCSLTELNIEESLYFARVIESLTLIQGEIDNQESTDSEEQALKVLVSSSLVETLIVASDALNIQNATDKWIYGQRPSNCTKDEKQYQQLKTNLTNVQTQIEAIVSQIYQTQTTLDNQRFQLNLLIEQGIIDEDKQDISFLRDSNLQLSRQGVKDALSQISSNFDNTK